MSRKLSNYLLFGIMLFLTWLHICHCQVCVGDACDRPDYCDNFLYAADPVDCTSFYRCVSLQWQQSQCGNNTYFDTSTCRCTHQNMAVCHTQCPTVEAQPVLSPGM